MLCMNCGKPIHYNKDLQTWHHDHNNYDACVFRSGRVSLLWAKAKQGDPPKAEPIT